MSLLLEKYNKEIKSHLAEKFNYKNMMALPKIKKVVVNMGVGRATENKSYIEWAVTDLTSITAQKPVITKSRQAVAGFKLRKDIPIGCKVTLRGKRMFEFLERLISCAIPRIRDFRGIPNTSFDKAGNFTMGISDQSVFPEINIDKVQAKQGMDITIVLKSKGRDESFELLKELGFPFKKERS